jgi:phosphatidylglycerophosphate synthase
VTPNRVSVAAFMMGGVATPVLIARHRLRAAGAAFVVSDLLDYLDGDVARAQGSTSPEGDVLDGILDRYTDSVCVGAMTLVGLGGFGTPERVALLGKPAARVVAATGLAAMVGCLMPSYIHALAVANRRRTIQSFGGRGTRNRVVFIGLFAKQPFWTTVVLAALSNAAAIHRAVFAFSRRGGPWTSDADGAWDEHVSAQGAGAS